MRISTVVSFLGGALFLGLLLNFKFLLNGYESGSQWWCSTYSTLFRSRTDGVSSLHIWHVLYPYPLKLDKLLCFGNSFIVYSNTACKWKFFPVTVSLTITHFNYNSFNLFTNGRMNTLMSLPKFIVQELQRQYHVRLFHTQPRW